MGSRLPTRQANTLHKKKTKQNMVSSKLSAIGFLLASTTSAYRSNKWKQMYNARRSSSIGKTDIEDHISMHKIIIDTRTAEEREEYEVESLLVDLEEQPTYVIVDYDNFYQGNRFFDSFKKGSEWYNSDNDGHDIDIFPDLEQGTSQLPAEMADMGSDILLLFGQRSCGCRWNLMWMHGFRGHHYYNSNVNYYIASLDQEEE